MSWEDNITCVDVRDRAARKVCRRCEAPLTGRHTVYCSRMCAFEFGRDHFGYRFYALQRAAGHCGQCGVEAKLEVHHIIPINGGPRHTTCLNHRENLVALCHDCHQVETRRFFG